jgi:SNF2 family DNA or RNA helicase
MLDREKPIDYGKPSKCSFWKPDRNGTYVNVITGSTVSKKPSQILGGIIADDMGVGKTIQCISLIVASKPSEPIKLSDETILQYEEPTQQRFSFGFVPPRLDPKLQYIQDEEIGTIASITTLIVCPLSTVANWEDQIISHVMPETLSYYIYHGPTREQNPQTLARFDVVITTYNILAMNFSKVRLSIN